MGQITPFLQQKANTACSVVVQTVLDFELIIVSNFVLIDHLFSIWILPTKSMLAQKERKSVFQKTNHTSFDHVLTWSKDNTPHSKQVNQCNYQKDTMQQCKGRKVTLKEAA